jgi:uncharacterized protein YcfJ
MKTLLITTALILLSTSANAQNITDHYKEVIMKQPYTVEVCTKGGHPGNNKSDISNFLEGAIVGGAIGNNIPGEKNGGAIGAFLGGVLNTERNKNTGPSCRTETRYEEEASTIYSHSTITFEYDGRQHTLSFKK